METGWQDAESWCVTPVCAKYYGHFISPRIKAAILTDKSIYPVYSRLKQLRDCMEIIGIRRGFGPSLWHRENCCTHPLISQLRFQAEYVIGIMIFTEPELHIWSGISNCQNDDKHNKWCILLTKHSSCCLSQELLNEQLLPLLPLNKQTASSSVAAEGTVICSFNPLIKQVGLCCNALYYTAQKN